MAEFYETNLNVGTPGFIGRSESFVDLHNGSIHGGLLNDLTSNVGIVLGQ